MKGAILSGLFLFSSCSRIQVENKTSGLIYVIDGNTQTEVGAASTKAFDFPAGLFEPVKKAIVFDGDYIRIATNEKSFLIGGNEKLTFYAALGVIRISNFSGEDYASVYVSLSNSPSWGATRGILSNGKVLRVKSEEQIYDLRFTKSDGTVRDVYGCRITSNATTLLRLKAQGYEIE